MTSFSALHTCELAGPALQDLPAALTQDISQSPSAILLRLHILHPLLLMRTKTDKMLEEAEMRYRRHFDWLVRNLTAFCPGDHVYFHRPPTLNPAAERIGKELRSQLLLEFVGPFQISGTTLHTTAIEEEWLSNVISIDSKTTTAQQKMLLGQEVEKRQCYSQFIGRDHRK